MNTDYRTLIHKLDAAWNSHDLERILDFYSEDFELTSPNIKRHLNLPDGTIKGKACVREWWGKILALHPDLRSELVSVTECIDSVAYAFRSSYTGTVTVSVFSFDERGKIRKEFYYT